MTTTQHAHKARSRWTGRCAEAHARKTRMSALRRELSTYTSPADLDELNAMLKRAGGNADADVISVVDQVRLTAR